MWGYYLKKQLLKGGYYLKITKQQNVTALVNTRIISYLLLKNVLDKYNLKDINININFFKLFTYGKRKFFI